MPAKIILNPYANRWGCGQLADTASSILQRLGYDFTLVQTNRPGEATILTQQAVANGYDPIVAAVEMAPLVRSSTDCWLRVMSPLRVWASSPWVRRTITPIN